MFLQMFQSVCTDKKNRNLVAILFSNTHLCIIPTSTDPNCIIFVRQNINVSHCHHLHNSEHVNNISSGICVYNLFPY